MLFSVEEEKVEVSIAKTHSYLISTSIFHWSQESAFPAYAEKNNTVPNYSL